MTKVPKGKERRGIKRSTSRFLRGGQDYPSTSNERKKRERQNQMAGKWPLSDGRKRKKADDVYQKHPPPRPREKGEKKVANGTELREEGRSRPERTTIQ